MINGLIQRCNRNDKKTDKILFVLSPAVTLYNIAFY